MLICLDGAGFSVFLQQLELLPTDTLHHFLLGRQKQKRPHLLLSNVLPVHQKILKKINKNLIISNIIRSEKNPSLC